jgi:hypothetical protein
MFGELGVTIMAKLGSLQLKGASGTTYDFSVHTADANWSDGLACVYYVSKRTEKPGGGGSHAAIYVGETEDMKARHLDHHKQACFERHGYNAISIHRESSEQTRLKIEADLVRALALPCNG